MADEIVPNSVGWYILEGYPWWPVYICDVTKLRPNLYLLGDGHKKILKKARDFPSDFIVVYYFGSHNLYVKNYECVKNDGNIDLIFDSSLVGLKKGVLRPWDCAQKDQFLKGHPKHLIKKKGTIETLLVAVQEVEEYLSQPEDIRLPQYMVPSDLDPTLEPPPLELVPQGIEQDEVEEEETMDVDDEDALEEQNEDEFEVEKKKKKKKKKKAEREKKEKKEEKEKKGEKEKKSKKAGDKKRKKAEDTKSVSPVKVIKTSQETDAKSELSTEKRDTDEAKPRPVDMTTETLSVVLEKEIRWILVNCPFEEMTTKTVRKLLEERLSMDLRHHKASIKEGVARVIASMEEEDAVDSASTAPEESAATTEGAAHSDVKAEANETSAPVPCKAVVENEVDAVKEEEMVRASKIESTKNELEAASKNLSLALELEPKIMDALTPLKSLDNVNRDVLAASTLQPRLMKLRAHRSPTISELVTFLVKKWDVEELVPAPKPITKEEILVLKEKLENSETSHDELLVFLNQLADMALTIDHLKKTGIARVVSKLRQHGNDKVSAKAHELRQNWIKQSNEQPTDNDSSSNSLKTLKTLNRILGQQSDGTDEQKLQNKQLAALEQLHSMSLDTRDIIDSKVGIPVSKLRKSSNEKVAKLAKKLRKKWQAEANA